MAFHVCNGALLKCSFGMAPATLVVLPLNRMMSGGMPAANIMDHAPMLNILPFGVCQSLANPAVAAATSAALGVLTPMPCVPVTPAPWVAGAPTAMLAYVPALNNTSVLNCAWGGVIQVSAPGQNSEMIP